MILETGDKILAVHRRLFQGDHGRFFLGEVDAFESGIAKATGHTWIAEPIKGEYQRKAGTATKLLALASGTLIVYQLPDDLDLDRVTFDSSGKRTVLTQGDRFVIDLSEGPAPAATRAQSSRR